jgi:hypothetical protein
MKKSVPLILLVVCAALFVVGVLELFKLRFDVGDVYAPYSSLRSDPLGTMALYESIGKLPGISAQRDFSADNHLPENPDTTYLHLAAYLYQWTDMPEDTFAEVERYVKSGGRLVITMFPQASNEFDFQYLDSAGTNAAPAPKTNSRDKNKSNGTNDVKNAKDTNGTTGATPLKSPKAKKKNPLLDEDTPFKFISIEEKWGVGFSITNLSKGTGEAYEPAQVENQTDLPLPESLDWHSGIILTNLDKAWHVIYARGTNPVVVERKFSRGSVVIATDSYFVSNEAMLKDRHADFLAWLVGPGKTVVFDEAHLGVMETGGVSGLMRKYHLYWFIGALLLLALLFIWKNSLSLVPPHAEERQQEFIAGKEAAAGFVNLLRRNIAPRALLETCFNEWKKSAAQTGKYSKARLQQAEAIFAAEKSLSVNDQNPLRTYQEISQALTDRTQHATRNTETRPS